MKITIPTSLAEITLNQYLIYLDMIKESESLPVDKQDEFISIKMLEIFCNISFADALKIETTYIIEIVNKLKEIIESENGLVTFFSVGKLKFGFVPDLDKLNYGEFLDLNNNISEWDRIHIAMGVLYRPITKKIGDMYTIEDYKGDKYHNEIKQMPMSAVVGAMFFFYNLGMDLAISTGKYLEKEVTKMQTTNKGTFQKSGVGIVQLKSLQEAM
jgi:hypothetical protein